jgi:hypothetical protein
MVVLAWHGAFLDFLRACLQEMGFGDFLQLSVLQLNRPLLQVLAEHWESRSNAFVLPVNILTIMVEDMVRLMIR